ncbi:MAG: GAF domain-containing protein [Chloroflexi bacterium]|nr:GAF domain-containing protein [Chloroflexota bacterium]
MQRQAAQLKALHEAGLTLASELNLDAVLQRVVDLARELVGARYGALGVFDERGDIIRFLTSGITADERARLGDPPKGRGLLGAVLADGRAVRVDDIARDPRSVGFPLGHPAMTTLLGMPVVARGRIVGNIYLTDKHGPGGSEPFSPADEELLQLFAAQAAVAIENARLHAAVQGLAAVAERERIARELHDSLAQALGYLRLRAAVGRDALQGGDAATVEKALADIADVAGEAYADVREAILGLRSRVSSGRDLPSALAEYLERYRLQTGLDVDLALGEELAETRVAPEAEVQLLRIIQEALANVRRHAGARRAALRLERAGGATGPVLRVTISDDGRGFDPQRLPGSAHFGLATMRERAEVGGGSLRVASAPGRGTQVIVDFPVEFPLEATASQPASTSKES